MSQCEWSHTETPFRWLCASSVSYCVLVLCVTYRSSSEEVAPEIGQRLHMGRSLSVSQHRPRQQPPLNRRNLQPFHHLRPALLLSRQPRHPLLQAPSLKSMASAEVKAGLERKLSKLLHLTSMPY